MLGVGLRTGGGALDRALRRTCSDCYKMSLRKMVHVQRELHRSVENGVAAMAVTEEVSGFEAEQSTGFGAV